MLNIQINGIDVHVAHGTMIIDAAEQAGIHIPRFCYHKKLSTAASCRMCLVEVEKMAKVVPACATPVGDGMKIHTKSPKALSGQRGVLEFLLINHPLDCPVCDQGGECPLQDAAMGFGAGSSRYTFEKRTVAHPDFGPLVATDMERCIHCTRCLRFAREIAGVVELGAIRRGERMAITNYENAPLTSELSGNLIDLCPVGALTSKPARFGARSWELQAHDAIGPHDSFGSHLRLDTRNGRVVRVVARECEDINETWISDRDRFSYQGLYSDDRLQAPRIRENGTWREVDWPTALEFVAHGLNKVHHAHGPAALGALVGQNATLEESYLLQKLLRALGSNNIDHRLRHTDFADPALEAPFPWLGCSIAELEQKDTFFVIGSNLRKEHPLVNHRIRKALFWGGSRAIFLDAVARDYNYTPSATMVISPSLWLRELMTIVMVMQTITGQRISEAIEIFGTDLKPEAIHQFVAEALIKASSPIILFGNLLQAHPHFMQLRTMSGLIAELANAAIGYLPVGAGTAGAWLAGCVPHRGPGAKHLVNDGQDWYSMVTGGVKGLVVCGAELNYDCANPAAAMKGLKNAEFVVSLTPWTSPAQEEYSHALLPIAPYAETSGTYINLEGRLQSFHGATPPLGETRPGWKVLRVMANLLDVAGFEYFSSDEVLNEARSAIGEVRPGGRTTGLGFSELILSMEDGVERCGEVPPYAIDALVRRAPALQATPDGQKPICARMHSATAARHGLMHAKKVTVRQADGAVDLPLIVDDRVAIGCVVVPAGVAATSMLGVNFGAVQLQAAD